MKTDERHHDPGPQLNRRKFRGGKRSEEINVIWNVHIIVCISDLFGSRFPTELFKKRIIDSVILHEKRKEEGIKIEHALLGSLLSYFYHFSCFSEILDSVQTCHNVGTTKIRIDLDKVCLKSPKSDKFWFLFSAQRTMFLFQLRVLIFLEEEERAKSKKSLEDISSKMNNI